MSEERKKHTAQLEIISGYRNKIVMDKLQVEDILVMLDSDYEYLEQENALINTNELLADTAPVKPVEDEKMIVKGDMICPLTKLHCDDECCTVGSTCNLSGDGISSPVQPSLIDASRNKVQLSNITDQNGIDLNWIKIWEQVEIWYGDHTKKESGRDLLLRLQSEFSTPVKPSIQSGVEEAAKEYANQKFTEGDRSQNTIPSHFLWRNRLYDFKAGAEWQAQQVKQPVMQWVSVEDRLPNFDEKVLFRGKMYWKKEPDNIIYFVDKLTTQEETLDYGQWAYLLDDESDFLVSQNPLLKEICQQYITHWTPLPAPPQYSKQSD